MNKHQTLPAGGKETPRRSSVFPGVFVAGIMSAWILLLGIQSSHAGSATWQLLPSSGDWNDAANWTNATVPNGAADTATFNASTVTHISLSADTEVNGIVFSAGSSTSYTIVPSPALLLNISGVGITNNSGVTQNFVIASADQIVDLRGFEFTNSATAGIQTAFTTQGANYGNANYGNWGFLNFDDHSSAGSGVFISNGGTVSGALGGTTEFVRFSTAGSGTFTTNGGAASGAHGASIQFYELSTAANGTFTTNSGMVSDAGAGGIAFFDQSSAGSGTFTINGGKFSGADGATIEFHQTSTARTGTFTTNGGAVIGASGGATRFLDSSTARDGTFTTNGGAAFGAKEGSTQFANNSTAANATLIANAGLAGSDGGTIYFFDDSTGGTPTVKVFGNGNLDISHHNAPGVSIGSLEGTGNVFLGFNDLTVGGNSLSTTFSGAIQDGGYGGGTGGGLIKSSGLGYGTLVLSGANTYTGATTVNNGVLQFAKRVSLYNAVSESWTKANIHVADGATAAFNVGGTGEFTNGDVTTLLGNLTVGINNNGFQAGSSIGFDTTNAVGGTFTIADLIADSTGAGSGSLGLTKLGDNTLILTAANTYSGATTVIAGKLEVDGSLASDLPMSVGSATLAGFGTFHSPTVVTSGAINGNGLTLTGLVTFNSTGNTLGGTETASSGVILAAGAVVTQSGTLTGNVWLTSGAGTSLTGSGTIGAVTMNGGGDAIAGNSTLTTAGLTINGSDNTVASGAVIGDAIFGSSAAASVNGAPAGPGTAGSGAALSVNGTLIGTATVGQGTLGGIGLVSGNVTLSGGTINFGNGGRIGGTLGVTGGNWTGAGSVTGLATSSSGAFTIGSGANLTANGDLSVTGGTIADDDGTSTITGSVSYTSSSSSNFGGVLAGGGKTLTLNNALAMLTLSGANTYTGPTTVTAGILAIDNDGITAFGTLGSGPTTVMGATVDAGSIGTLQFKRNASALSGAFITVGGTVSGASGGSARFLDTSTAGSATFTNNGGTAAGAGGGITRFDDDSSAGSATLIANGGTGGGNDGSILFSQNSTGGTARVEVIGNGNLDISPHNAPGVSIGSLEGTGNVFLGSKNLTVGTNNLSTTFSGVIQDGGIGGGASGSLAKTGIGVLVLSGPNTYTGGTIVNGGVLSVAYANNDGKSAVGSSNLTINNGATVRVDENNALGFNGNEPATTINAGGLLTASSTVSLHLSSLTLSGGTLASVVPSGAAATFGTYNLDNNLTAGGATTTSVISALFFALTTPGSTTFTVNPGAANGIDLDVTGTIGAPGSVPNSGLIKAGAGAMRLSNTNTFTAGITINAGTLNVAADANLGNPSGPVTFGGGTLENTASFALATTRAVTLNGGGGTFNTDPGTTLTIGSVISGPGGLTKNGSGTLTLSGRSDNTFTGSVNVNNGTLQFAKEISLYNGVPGSWTKANIRVADGGTAAFNVGGTGEFTNGDVTTLLGNLTVGINNNGFQAGSAIGLDTTNTAVTGNTQTFTIADVIADSAGTGSGSLGLTKLGTNTLALTGANIYTGSTTITFGNLVVDNDGITTFGALGSGPTTILANDSGLAATLQFKHIASAGGAAITNNGGAAAFQGGGVTVFLNSSTAGSGAFTNNGGTTNFASGGGTQFFNNSTAANGTFTNNGGGAVGAHGGSTLFYDASTAGNGTFTTNGGAVSDAFGALLYFQGSSTAGNGIFTTNGGAVSGADGGVTRFDNFSTAGSGTFVTNGAAVGGAINGITEFFSTTSAGNATLIANGGLGGGEGGKILIAHDSTGGTARVEVFGNGNLDLSAHNAPGVSIGSLEGTGNVFLGRYNLTVGGNNLNTTFSGVIQNGGTYGGTGGSFTKTGTGTTTLSGDNTYTGDDTVSAGTLKFNITSGAPAIGSGVTATVAAGATLELAGSVSALGTAGGNRVHVVNNSTASGVVVSGTNQVVGNIDGSGITQVNAGSDLTANHIIQAALVIEGTSKNPGLVTIAASDASGSPLDQTSGLALAGSLSSSGPFGADGITSINLSSGGLADLGVPSFGDSVGHFNPLSVPEPSTLMLMLLPVALLVGCRKRWPIGSTGSIPGTVSVG